MPAPTRVTFKVTDEDVGRRLDQVLAARVPGLSRRQARVLLDIGGVFVDKRRIKIAGRAMHAGEEVVAVLGGALARATGRTGTSAREGDERRLPAYAVVFEDEELVVVDKPAGLLTAPTPESDRNNLSDLLARREGARGEIFVVHRIDLDTSGLLVLAKTPDANRALSARFRDHDIERVYLTVVAGAFPSDVATIDQPIAAGAPSRTSRSASGSRPGRRCSPAASRPDGRTRFASTSRASDIPSSATPATAGPLVRLPPGWRCTPRRWALRTRAMDAR